VQARGPGQQNVRWPGERAARDALDSVIAQPEAAIVGRPGRTQPAEGARSLTHLADQIAERLSRRFHRLIPELVGVPTGAQRRHPSVRTQGFSGRWCPHRPGKHTVGLTARSKNFP
jgi:hypothetical protein